MIDESKGLFVKFNFLMVDYQKLLYNIRVVKIIMFLSKMQFYLITVQRDPKATKRKRDSSYF